MEAAQLHLLHTEKTEVASVNRVLEEKWHHEQKKQRQSSQQQNSQAGYQQSSSQRRQQSSQLYQRETVTLHLS